MKVLWYNSTQLAGMPYRTAKVMNRFLEPEGGWARSVCTKTGYGDGRVFPVDLVPNSPEANQAIQEADIAIVGSYMADRIPQRPDLPVVRHYSTEQTRWKPRDRPPEAGTATVVGQYQAQFAPQLEVLPNCIPVDDPFYSPGEKPDDCVRIVYSPTSRAASGWAAKSYQEVIQALRVIGARSEAGEYPLPVEVYVLERQPYESVMEVKRRAHICIDEFSTGSYHSNGLEGLSTGCATFCWLSNNVRDTLQRMMPEGAMDEGLPFDLVTKSKILPGLETFAQNPDMLRARGQWARDWMVKWYSEEWQASTWINWHRSYLRRLGGSSCQS